MKNFKNSFIKKVLPGLFCILFLAVGTASALDIVLEPATAQRDLGGEVRVHIYANSADSLISMGVKVTFNKDLLQVISAEKYTAFADGWIMDADGVDTQPPPDPNDQYTTPAVEIDNANGTVMMMGGRLMGAPSEPPVKSLSGKVLLGWIVFQASATNYGTSDLIVDVAKTNPNPGETFDNFVQLDGTPVTPANVPSAPGTFKICVVDNACEGDVNGDGVVNPLDTVMFKTAFPSSFGMGNYDPRCDLNGDSAINPLDTVLFKTDFPRSNCPSCP